MPAPCGLRGCKNRPAPFPGRMSYKATKPGLVCVLYLSMFYIVLFLLGPFLCIVSVRCYMFCLLVVLVKLSVLAPSDWLERPSEEGSLIVARGSSPESPGRRVLMIFSWFIVFIASLFYYVCVVSRRPYVIYFPTFMARYSLFVLKVLLNPKQTNKQTLSNSKRFSWEAFGDRAWPPE